MPSTPLHEATSARQRLPRPNYLKTAPMCSVLTVSVLLLDIACPSSSLGCWYWCSGVYEKVVGGGRRIPVPQTGFPLQRVRAHDVPMGRWGGCKVECRFIEHVHVMGALSMPPRQHFAPPVCSPATFSYLRRRLPRPSRSWLSRCSEERFQGIGIHKPISSTAKPFKCATSEQEGKVHPG